MDNLVKIREFSEKFYLLLSVISVMIPTYYVVYWAFVNYLPESLININTAPVPVSLNVITVRFQLVGFVASLFPLSALMCVILNIRKLFSFYIKGKIFSFEHVSLFKKTAKALVMWVVLSMIYESVKSVVLSSGNPPGSRVLTIGFSSAEITTLLVGGIVFIIAHVMDEGRILNEENKLTV